MTPERAIHLGVPACAVRVGSHPRFDVWQAYVPDPERGRRVLTEGNLFSMCQWRAKLLRLAGE